MVIYPHVSYMLVGRFVKAWQVGFLRSNVSRSFGYLPATYCLCCQWSIRSSGSAVDFLDPGPLIVYRVFIYCIYIYNTPKVLRPYFVSPCRKWHKKGSSPRNHSNAEVLRPRVYSNVVGFHGRGFIAMSWVLRPRVYSNVRWRSTHDYSRFTHDYRAAICTF